MMRLFHSVYKYQHVAKNSLTAIRRTAATLSSEMNRKKLDIFQTRFECEFILREKRKRDPTLPPSVTLGSMETLGEWCIRRRQKVMIFTLKGLDERVLKYVRESPDPSLLQVYDVIEDKEAGIRRVIVDRPTCSLQTFLARPGAKELLFRQYTHFRRATPLFQKWIRDSLMTCFYLEEDAIIYAPTVRDTFVVEGIDGPRLQFSPFAYVAKDESSDLVIRVMDFAIEILRILDQVSEPVVPRGIMVLRTCKVKFWNNIGDLVACPFFMTPFEELMLYVRFRCMDKRKVLDEKKYEDLVLEANELVDVLEGLNDTDGFPKLDGNRWFPKSFSKSITNIKFETRHGAATAIRNMIRHEDKFKKVMMEYVDGEVSLLPSYVDEKYALGHAIYVAFRMRNLFP